MMSCKICLNFANFFLNDIVRHFTCGVPPLPSSDTITIILVLPLSINFFSLQPIWSSNKSTCITRKRQIWILDKVAPGYISYVSAGCSHLHKGSQKKGSPKPKKTVKVGICPIWLVSHPHRWNAKKRNKFMFILHVRLFLKHNICFGYF